MTHEQTGANENAVLLYALPAMSTRDLSFPRMCRGLAWAACLLWLPSAVALERVAVADVTVEANGETVFTEAMRVALVRVTGRRSAADDPIFASLLRDARQYVQLYLPAAADSPARVSFDAAALTQAVRALGQPLWSEMRPVVLGVVLSAPAGADAQAVRQALERGAAERGLPLRLRSASSVGLAANAEISADLALAAARRAGADLALVAEADGAEWQWTLFDGASATAFSGGITVGVESAADLLALSSQAATSRPVTSTSIRIRGLGSLRDVSEAERALAVLPGAGSVSLVEIGSGEAVFRIDMPGGDGGLADALAQSSRLRLESRRASLPTYRWER